MENNNNWTEEIIDIIREILIERDLKEEC